MKHWASYLLCLVFAAGTIGAFYDSCAMEMPAAAPEAMAGMDCHGEQAPAKSEKKCCLDFSCTKCFSSPLALARTTLKAQAMPAILSFASIAPIFFYRPDVPERPPKIG